MGSARRLHAYASLGGGFGQWWGEQEAESHFFFLNSSAGATRCNISIAYSSFFFTAEAQITVELNSM